MKEVPNSSSYFELALENKRRKEGKKAVQQNCRAIVMMASALLDLVTSGRVSVIGGVYS